MSGMIPKNSYANTSSQNSSYPPFNTSLAIIRPSNLSRTENVHNTAIHQLQSLTDNNTHSQDKSLKHESPKTAYQLERDLQTAASEEIKKKLSSQPELKEDIEKGDTKIQKITLDYFREQYETLLLIQNQSRNKNNTEFVQAHLRLIEACLENGAEKGFFVLEKLPKKQ